MSKIENLNIPQGHILIVRKPSSLFHTFYQSFKSSLNSSLKTNDQTHFVSRPPKTIIISTFFLLIIFFNCLAMAELRRYRAWYHRSRLTCRKTTAKFLVTLLILPNFPEQVCMAQQHRHHSFQQRRQQPFAQPRNTLHRNSTINNTLPTIGAIRNVARVKGK